jgi:hypothetical protein
MAPSKLRQEREVEFLDIRREKREQSLLQATLEGLDPNLGDARSLPTLLLYDGQCRSLWTEGLELMDVSRARIEIVRTDNISR